MSSSEGWEVGRSDLGPGPGSETVLQDLRRLGRTNEIFPVPTPIPPSLDVPVFRVPETFDSDGDFRNVFRKSECSGHPLWNGVWYPRKSE